MFSTKNVFFLFFFFVYGVANGQIITTFAGYDTSGYSGDEGPATAATLNNPLCSLPDAAGNVYIADWGNNRIRIVNASGIITTFAGNGTMIHSGDGGPATAAGIIAPHCVALDAAGNLYITEAGTDTSGPFVRKVNTAGIISTIAGNGTPGYSGDGGPAIAAQFGDVKGIAVDGGGNVYVADDGNFVIRKINASGIISTIAGNDTAGYSGDGGPATAAEFALPSGLALDGSGNLYVSDYSNNRVRKIDAAGIVTTIAGNGTIGYTGDTGPATAAALHYPAGLATDGTGNIYIADEGNSVIRKINATGIINTIAGDGIYGYSGDGGHATAAKLSAPAGVALDGAGNIFIADADANNVREVVPNDVGVTAIKPANEEQKDLSIWPDPSEGTFTVFVPSTLHEVIQIVITNTSGQIIKEINTTTNKEEEIQLDAPTGIYLISIVSGLQGKQCTKMMVR